MSGRYGPYVKWGKINATIPPGNTPETITLEQALALIAAKTGKTGKKAKPAKKAKAPAKKAKKSADAQAGKDA
jgi:DNA topoisomerase-1